MLTTLPQPHERVNFKYPTHGNRNVLRDVIGEVDRTGKGPNGPFVVVNQDDGEIRSFSVKKIVTNL
jgi:hypothetical protein